MDSIDRCAVMVQKLMEALSLSPTYISLLLLAGQYEAFMFDELKSTFDKIEGTLFYKQVFALKDKGYIHKVGLRKSRNVWALTPLGAEVHKRMKAYISRNIKETYK